MPNYRVHVTFKHPAYDERGGLDYDVYADTKADAVKRARRRARDDGHTGTLYFKAEEVPDDMANPRGRKRKRTRKNDGAQSGGIHIDIASHNPPFAVFGNPGGSVMGEVVEIRYKHHDDGKYYRHPFRAGVLAIALKGGAVLLRHRQGKPLWEDFPE